VVAVSNRHLMVIDRSARVSDLARRRCRRPSTRVNSNRPSHRWCHVRSRLISAGHGLESRRVALASHNTNRQPTITGEVVDLG
jgi:hypothetical protein